MIGKSEFNGCEGLYGRTKTKMHFHWPLNGLIYHIITIVGFAFEQRKYTGKSNLDYLMIENTVRFEIGDLNQMFKNINLHSV